MNKGLAEILGWEERAIYQLEDKLYTVKGCNLLFTYNDYDRQPEWEPSYLIIGGELEHLVNNATKIEHRRYYLKHRFLGRWGMNYLNYHIKDKVCFLEDTTPDEMYKTKFTNGDIEGLVALGLNLSEYEKIEIK